jgi:hypothetical protein
MSSDFHAEIRGGPAILTALDIPVVRRSTRNASSLDKDVGAW